MDENCWPIDADSMMAVYFMKSVHLRAEGTLPHPVPQARLRQSPLTIYPPQFVLEACMARGTVITAQQQPTPFRVDARLDIPLVEEITVNTRSGPQCVPVRVVKDPVAPPTGLDEHAASGSGMDDDVPSLRIDALFDGGASAATVVVPGKRVEATGYSRTFDLAEALEEAIQNLPPDPKPYPDKLTLVRVVQIGAELGGFPGFHRMFVRVSANR